MTDEPSPRGEDDLETALSVLSELDPLWLRRSADVAVEEDELVEEDKGFAFSLKSVMMTVRSPTVTSKCCALLLSTFFNLGLLTEEKKAQVNQTGDRKLFKILNQSSLVQMENLKPFFHYSLLKIKALLKIPVN